jgi:phospholipase/carboxylesterase
MSAFSLSRRSALLAAMGWAASACHSRTEPASVEADSEEDAASEPFGGLQYATGGDLAENERGGTTVVLLHGFGASADDLISLARAIAQSRTRYIVPAGPLELHNGGSAWWPMRKRPSYSAEQVLVVPEQKLAPARSAVQGLLTSVKQRFSPESLFLIGFSQGAMLALDVALMASVSVDRVAVLSGALLADAVSRIATPRETHPAVFVSHGRQDPVLRFQGAEHLVDALKSQGFSVTFRPFDGGHEISPDTTDALKAFLQG